MISKQLVKHLKKPFKSKSYIYLTLGFFVCGWHIALVATHIPIYINDRGLPEWCTVTILSMIGIFNIAGTLTSGYLAQKFSKKLILSSIYLARGLVIAIFIFLPPSPIIAVFVWNYFWFFMAINSPHQRWVWSVLYLELNILDYCME